MLRGVECSSRSKYWKYRRGFVADLTRAVRLNPPPKTSRHDPVIHFLDSVNNLFDHVLKDVGNADMVGITIHEVNQSDNPIGFSFRRKDQLLSNVIWSVFDKVSQSNGRFNASDTLIVTVHSVTVPLDSVGTE